MRLDRVRVLSFDCYGTLIDWERGVLAALAPWRARTGIGLGDRDLLAAFGRHEAAQQAATPAMLYRDLLAAVAGRLGLEAGAPLTEAEAASFGASVPDWPAFPDSAEALSRLKQRFRLIILSNVDEGGFLGSQRRLGTVFDAVLTAEAIGSYKPAQRNFGYLMGFLRAHGFGRDAHLHVAQSLFHDHVPAKEAGIATCWIDRAGAALGGIELPALPDHRFRTLAEFADFALS
jgi:2-haloalkanoic acid dehalogenase type II